MFLVDMEMQLLVDGAFVSRIGKLEA